jgi:hypothetical protein
MHGRRIEINHNNRFAYYSDILYIHLILPYEEVKEQLQYPILCLNENFVNPQTQKSLIKGIFGRRGFCSKCLALSYSCLAATIGAEALDCRVRDGIGYTRFARSAKHTEQNILIC